MLKSIIRKEILNNLFSYKFSIIVILSTILILISIFVMYGDYCLALENYEIIQQESDEPTAVIRPTPLSIFAKGLEPFTTRSVWRSDSCSLSIHRSIVSHTTSLGEATWATSSR